jgi:hypothetical protein
MVRQQRCAVRSIRTRGVGTSRDGHHRSGQPGLIPVRPRSAMRRASMVGSCVPGGAEDRRPHDWIRTVVAAHLLRVPGLPAHLVERGRHRSGVLVPAGSGRLLRLARQSSLPATVRPADLPPAQGGGHPAPDAALTPGKPPLHAGHHRRPGSLAGGSKAERPVTAARWRLRYATPRAGSVTCRTIPQLPCGRRIGMPWAKAPPSRGHYVQRTHPEAA